MATEFWIGLFMMVTVPLIVYSWNNLINRITRVDQENTAALAKLETVLRKDLVDKHTDLRHQIRNLQNQLVDTLNRENRELSDQTAKTLKLMMELLREPVTDEIVARRSIKHRGDA